MDYRQTIGRAPLGKKGWNVFVSSFRLVPATSHPEFLSEPLAWSLALWGEGKEEFTADDWRGFYSRVLSANYESWDTNVEAKEMLFLALPENSCEVLAVIGLCDFDDLEEFRALKPWLCAFIVREDLRHSGIGSQVLELMEQKVREYGIELVYLWTEDELDFYLKRGYEKFEELAKPNRLLHIMRKTI